MRLPCASGGISSAIEFQDPMSFQSKRAGTMATRSAFSITA
jgi:hypothetical protein